MEATIPFNGSGTFSRLYSWVVDAANNINILSTKMDAEMNGMAAALTNCVTRDGQSPPSADIPWGAKKITNLGLATVGTDALSQNAGDARYMTLTASDARYLQLSGGALTGGLTSSATITGQTPNLPSTGGIRVQQNATNGLATLEFINSAASATLAYLQSDASGNVTVNATSWNCTGTLKRAGNVVWDAANLNSAAIATILGFTPANNALVAPLASPALTGTPTAPTAAAGTATTQLATTAFVDTLRDVPSNAKVASYPLALTDRGGGVDFNGTTLTCTIPANASVAFPVGTTIVLTNINASSLSIVITTDTLTLAGTTTTGTRTLAQNGMATLRKITTTSWLISGAGLS